MTASGALEWKFIEEDQLTWALPTFAGLRAHDGACPRWEVVKTAHMA